MKTSAVTYVKHFALFAAIMGLWEVAARQEWVDSLLLPAPSKIFTALINIMFQSGLMWHHFGVTLYETVAGFLIGSVIGFVLAVLAAQFMGFKTYSTPYVIALQVTPRIALAPLIIAWFGFGISAKVVIAAVICFFPPFVNTLTGLLDYDRDRMEMFRSLRASRWQIFTQLQLPGAMPIIMAGLKTAISLALIGAIVGEFISASEGLGLLMQRFTFQLNMAASFAILVTLTLMGLILYWIMEVLDDRLVYWRHDTRLQQRATRDRRRYASLLKGVGGGPALQPAE